MFGASDLGAAKAPRRQTNKQTNKPQRIGWSAGSCLRTRPHQTEPRAASESTIRWRKKAVG